MALRVCQKDLPLPLDSFALAPPKDLTLLNLTPIQCNFVTLTLTVTLALTLTLTLTLALTLALTLTLTLTVTLTLTLT